MPTVAQWFGADLPAWLFRDAVASDPPLTGMRRALPLAERRHSDADDSDAGTNAGPAADSGADDGNGVDDGYALSLPRAAGDYVPLVAPTAGRHRLILVRAPDRRPRRAGRTLVVAGLVVVALVTAGLVATERPAAGHTGTAVPAAPAPRTGYVWPLPGTPAVVRGFDPPPEPWLPGHRGVDLAGFPGEPVLAAGAGIVAFAGPVAGTGVVSVDHAGGLRTTYEPVTPSVHAGQHVDAGQQIGTLLAGHPGCSASACLHWGLRRGDTYLDPLALLGLGHVRLLPLGPGANTARAIDHRPGEQRTVSGVDASVLRSAGRRVHPDWRRLPAPRLRALTALLPVHQPIWDGWRALPVTCPPRFATTAGAVRTPDPRHAVRPADTIGKAVRWTPTTAG